MGPRKNAAAISRYGVKSVTSVDVVSGFTQSPARQLREQDAYVQCADDA